MSRRIVNLRGWTVDVFIDGYDRDERAAAIDALYRIGADDDVLRRAERKLIVDSQNGAFTATVGTNTVIYIGPTTSGAEFINSMVHELRHLVDDIADYNGIGNGEEVGYMSGDAAFMLADDICRMGCRDCRG